MPLFMEALLVTFLLEIVREAGLRLPRPIGHSVSLVAALIVGDAAVNAGLLSTPVVIAAALSAICTFVVPSLYEPITVLRSLFVLAGGIFGPIGIAALLFVMVVNLCGMDSFGVPYLSPIEPPDRMMWDDGILRANWRKLAKEDFAVSDLPCETWGDD